MKHRVMTWGLAWYGRNAYRRARQWGATHAEAQQESAVYIRLAERHAERHWQRRKRGRR